MRLDMNHFNLSSLNTRCISVEVYKVAIEHRQPEMTATILLYSYGKATLILPTIQSFSKGKRQAMKILDLHCLIYNRVHNRK